MIAILRMAEPLGRRAWPPIALSSLLFITWVVFVGGNSPYWTSVAVKLFLTLMIVLGLQIFSGNSGVLSFGHVAFMAVGAYTSALLTQPTAIKEISFPAMPDYLSSWIFPAEFGTLEGTLIGGGFAAMFALITAAPVVRLAGIAAGIATLAILVIVNVFIVQTRSITNGTQTMIAVPLTTTLTSVFVWSVIFVFVAFAFQQSRFGLRLRAARENERAARSIGVRVTSERAIAWVISGFVVGVAGALYGHYFVFSATDFYFNNGLDLVLITIAMLVVGGMTSVTGAVVGCYVVTVVFTFFNHWTIGFLGTTLPAGTDNFALALLLLVVLIWRPHGLLDGREVPWPSDWTLRWLAYPRRKRRPDRPVVRPPRQTSTRR